MSVHYKYDTYRLLDSNAVTNAEQNKINVDESIV